MVILKQKETSSVSVNLFVKGFTGEWTVVANLKVLVKDQSFLD